MRDRNETKIKGKDPGCFAKAKRFPATKMCLNLKKKKKP